MEARRALAAEALGDARGAGRSERARPRFVQRAAAGVARLRREGFTDLAAAAFGWEVLPAVLGSTGSNASGRAWEMSRIKLTFNDLRTSGGTSDQSFRFCSGKSTCRIPERAAARTFSLMPPTGNTRPRRLISPVIATSDRTFRRERIDASATVSVIPALGPSFGVAPAGT